MSRLGIGLAAVGRPAYITLGREATLPADRSVAAMREQTWRVLDAAYALGIRWVDVARSYGLAEEFLAGWLRERGFADVTVSTKWGYEYVGGWRMDADVHEVKEHSVARFSRQWQESRQLLGDRITLYQVHSLTLDSPVFTDRALLAALAALDVRVGFSTSGPARGETIDRALDLAVDGKPVFTAVQSTWNVLEPSAGPALERAHERGAYVLLKEVLANGRLAIEAPSAVAGIARRHEATPDVVAVAAALSQPWADTILVGPATAEQLVSNLGALSVKLDDTDLAQLSTVDERAVDYWTTRASLPWA